MNFRLVERLSQDFSDRPEHQRELARTLMNLGNVLSAQNQPQDAEPILRRAIGVNATITAKNSEDPQIRLDLAKCHNNLGELLRKQGDTEEALASFLAARSINEALVKAFPDQPRYSDSLASNLTNLALLLVHVDPLKVEATNRAALAIYTKLVADYPENFPYRLGLVRCLRNLGNVLAATDKPKQAEVMYKEALAKLESKDAKNQSPEGLRVQADLLNCLAELDLPGPKMPTIDRSQCRKASLTPSRRSDPTAMHWQSFSITWLSSCSMRTASRKQGPFLHSRSLTWRNSRRRHPRQSMSRVISASFWPHTESG